MKNAYTIILLMAVIFSFNGLNSKSLDSLWMKAIAISKANSNWIPGKIIESEIIIDEDSNLEETNSKSYLVTKDMNSEIDIYLNSSFSNGEDNTINVRKKIQTKNQGQDFLEIDEVESPLHKDFQKNITKVNRFSFEFIDDKLFIIFSYNHLVKNILWQGKIWIEEKSATPFKLQIETNKEISQQRTTLRNFKTKVIYNFDSKRWFPKELSYNYDLETKVFPFITFKGSSETVIKLTDYFKLYDD